MGDKLEGQVLYGINNIYTVSVGSKRITCRIRGKVLRTQTDGDESSEYNPIAVGDRVEIAQDPYSEDKGWIETRLERTSHLSRFNKKRRAPQVIAANIDILVCVASVDQPPFRPRFVDRILISSHII